MVLCYQWFKSWRNWWNFLGKELQQTNQEKFRIEQVIKRKGKKFMSNGKDMMINLIAGSIKKTLNEIPLYKNEPILS